MGTATTPADDLAVTSVRISKSQLEQFKLIAAANQRSVSQQLRWMIHQAVAAAATEEAA